MFGKVLEYQMVLYVAPNIFGWYFTINNRKHISDIMKQKSLQWPNNCEITEVPMMIALLN